MLTAQENTRERPEGLMNCKSTY